MKYRLSWIEHTHAGDCEHHHPGLVRKKAEDGHVSVLAPKDKWFSTIDEALAVTKKFNKDSRRSAVIVYDEDGKVAHEVP